MWVRGVYPNEILNLKCTRKDLILNSELLVKVIEEKLTSVDTRGF